MPIITENQVRRPHDFYATEPALAREAIKYIPDSAVKHILDPGAGYGVWGREARIAHPSASITGVELQDFERPKGYYFWYNKQDYLQWNPPYDWEYDLIIGNPPYKLAERFIRHSLELLSSSGYLLFLLPLSFLASKRRKFGLWAEHKPKKIIVCSRRPSFYDGKTNADDYCLILWGDRNFNSTPSLEWMYYDRDTK